MYPVILGVKNKKCVVIGGGRVAQRKALALLKAGAQVYCLSKTATGKITNLAAVKKIVHVVGEYRSDFIKGAFW